ncbi:uncharacterized protein [Arachis hypogaea]|uniref:uncharacterized protein n=1 Tax=Arachis hypogaea TaxID=3818 RepID=UPI003B21D9A6
MAEPRRITLHEQGASDLILQPLQARYPNLDPNFELKNSLINLFPKYHGLSGQDPIRHLRDFQVACSTARRHGVDEIAIMVFAFPFSLEGQAKEWFYSQPDEVVTEWDLLRREFLDKFFPPKKTDYIRKEISGIMQKDQETLYEYWIRFKRLLESCPHHGLDTYLLISYFTRGLCVADKRLLTASSGGSLSKNKMAAEAWSLINDVAVATQHVRVRNNPLKGVVEAPPSESSLTKVLGDMTTLLTKIRKEQKAFYSIQAIQAPPQTLQLEGPPRICGLCSSTAHYTDQCHQVQEDYTLAVANEVDTRQEEEEASLKEPKRKAIMDESIPIPFPSMVNKAKETPEFDLNILQVFKKVEPIPEKCSDPRPCLVSCRIGGVAFHDCMSDLGACVSIIPLSIFARLKLAPLKRSAAKFALADKSVITVVGIAEDVLVAIKDLVFPVDFYILEMPWTNNRSSSSVFLGRPFLKTSKFKLDAFTGTYCFDVGDKTIKFNLEKAMRHPPKEHSILRYDVINEVVAEIQREEHDKLGHLVVEGEDKNEDEQEKVDEDELHDLSEKEPQLEAKSELRPLPSHLKYAFLEDNQKFLVIIASELLSQEEDKLLEVLRKHVAPLGGP